MLAVREARPLVIRPASLPHRKSGDGKRGAEAEEEEGGRSGSGRNTRNHGAKSWDSKAAAAHVAKMLEDMTCMEWKDEVRVTHRERWKPPDHGWIKVNTDGAFNPATSSGAFGVLIRDEEGQLIAAESRWLEHLPDALTAEAIAARDDMSIAVAKGFDRIIREVDCLPLANVIRNTDEDRSHISGIRQEIQEIGRQLRGFVISFIRREANSVAHRCAKEPTERDRLFSVTNVGPGWLQELVNKDCNPVD
ncbi:hypothetical protein PR202_gb14153 [Eleusine coracana subsp. coracana]|uniref:RNase H type-1 domain-containing protein n=1 Tax=Eleusine coracana subsp. coracana TaxID=191504 RepID=A0AAV5EVJ2_ELECO|nr:hypothetical protein PR202_gb14153 [Eleusine coracana subsp. coracana]